MPYCDNFWHIDAQENIPSPACLIVFVKSKTENQLIRFVIAYLVADNNVKNNVRQLLQRENPGLLTVLTLASEARLQQLQRSSSAMHSVMNQPQSALSNR